MQARRKAPRPKTCASLIIAASGATSSEGREIAIYAEKELELVITSRVATRSTASWVIDG